MIGDNKNRMGTRTNIRNAELTIKTADGKIVKGVDICDKNVDKRSTGRIVRRSRINRKITIKTADGKIFRGVALVGLDKVVAENNGHFILPDPSVLSNVSW